MSFSEDCRLLQQSFERSEELLGRLLAGLQARRAAWVSARPSKLAPEPELEQLGQDLAREDNRRDELVGRIQKALPAPLGNAPGPLHVNVTRIAAALPAAESRSLRDAADRVTKLARSVRTEVTLGQRLVRYAQDALRVPAPAGRANVPGYDRSARVRFAGNAAGALLDGKA